MLFSSAGGSAMHPCSSELNSCANKRYVLGGAQELRAGLLKFDTVQSFRKLGRLSVLSSDFRTSRAEVV